MEKILESEYLFFHFPRKNIFFFTQIFIILKNLTSLSKMVGPLTINCSMNWKLLKVCLYFQVEQFSFDVYIHVPALMFTCFVTYLGQKKIYVCLRSPDPPYFSAADPNLFNQQLFHPNFC